MIPSSLQQKTDQSIRRNSLHILLIEDDPGDALLIEELLNEVDHNQFKLTHMDRLKPGLEHLAAGGIDVVLLDLSLPDSQGFDTFEQLEKHTSGIPIIILTGLDDELLSMKAVRSGAQDYLVKGQIQGNMLHRSIRYAIERKHYDDQLEFLANYDPLTNAFNRHRFEQALEQQLAQAQRYNTPGAVLWLDLDQFKDINDSFGHRAGDGLLVDIAVLLQDVLREADILARLGGDTFAMLMPHTDEKQAQAAAMRILEEIRNHPFPIEKQPIRITASIGIVIFPEQGDIAESLLARADLAMYQAKEEGRNCFSTFRFDEDWQAQVESRIQWVRQLREALENDRFIFYAQPILNLKNNEITRYEVLLRLRGEEGEIISPGAFLNIAERFGLVQDIDRLVVDHAIAFIAQQASAQKIQLEINLSGKSIIDDELLLFIKQRLDATSVDPRSLILEITETAAVADLRKARSFVKTLQEMKCEFALDDFGVGFSSFNYLKHLPIDYLKIDGSFIQDLPHNVVDQHLVQAMVQVAKSLDKKTIAEFVEDEETLELLREYGVDYGQGFYIGRPQPMGSIL